MYKQKSWNVENMHMGVIKAFIVVSMLFVCMFSMKISARAEEMENTYYVKSSFIFSGSNYPYQEYIYKFTTTEKIALLKNPYINTQYILVTDKDGFYLNTSLIAKLYDSSETYCHDNDYGSNSSYVRNVYSDITYDENYFKSDWKPIESNLPIFESVEDAQYYFETGEIPQEVVRTPSYVNDKYIETYSLKGFECDITVSAKWTGHTRYIPPTLKPKKAIEKIIVEGLYFNADEYCTFDILDINTMSWSRDIEEIRVDENGNTLQYIYFTPYYYFEDDETIYYGNRIAVDPRDWSLGFGVVFDHDEYGNTYTMNNQVTDYNEDITLGYLQGVKREQEYEIGWGSGYRITWNTDNESLNDCHIQIALRGVQEKLSGPSLYNVVPYKQYKDNILYC